MREAMDDKIEELRGRLEAVDEGLTAQEQLVADLRADAQGDRQAL